MATTTAANNHNQPELRLYAPNEQQQQTANSTALTLASGARSPFQREVREWQRIDPDTGALLTGRLEADRWINGPLSKYGKISDSKNISQPNGTQQTQRKQLEVLQTCTPAGAAMQVIRSQTVQTTSSRWSTSSASASPLLLSANTSPIPQQQQQQQQLQLTNRNPHSKHSFTKQQTHTQSNNHHTISSSTTSTSSPLIATTLLTNGFNHKTHQKQQQQQHQLPQQHKKQQQHYDDDHKVDDHDDDVHHFAHSLVNGSGSRLRNWTDLNENISTLDICDNDHDNDYIVQQQSTDDDDDDDEQQQTDNEDDGDHDNDSLNDNDFDRNHDHDHHYMRNKRNNLKNTDFSKRHSFTVFANTDHDRHTECDSHLPNHHHHHNYNNLSRDSSSGSCSNNNNQLFLLDTAPSLKLSNLMKSSSSLSNSSNNSTTASQATAKTTSSPASMNTHKSMTTNKISLHAIVGNSGSSGNMTTASTTSSTPSPTTTLSSWQQPTLFRQNSHNNNNSNNNGNTTHLMKSRVGDNINNSINCCSSSSSSDESRSYAGKIETDHRHLRQSPNQVQQRQHQHQRQQQQIHFKQNDRLTPTHLPHSYHRDDLESFRHYNNNNNDNIANNNNNNNNNNSDIVDDDGLRLSNRHLRRQQIPYESSLNTLQRSRSISTDDLSTEWNIQGVDSEEPAEWRRVSKLRRSFQSTSKTTQAYNSSITARKPLDLPTNSVSVSKIRAELENGRRLNTVMRNNHVDLAALSSILNGSEKETKSPLTPKRDSFLTAESLKEIRGKLKKLSDESLYKEDFLINQQQQQHRTGELEHLVNDQMKIKRNYEKSPDRYRVTNKAEEVNNKHTTNSLESRTKYRDTNSTDWHIRRKSYGFEKMSPPEKAMLRMDASTDSGLGRSGELQNWSPTSEATGSNRTVVHFGEAPKVTSAPVVQRHYRPQKTHEESENSHEEDLGITKRHSVAVDESQYVRDSSRQTTQIHVNGFHEPVSYSKFVHSSESTTSNDRGQQKRVEFSKTEVHFATESGRVNIVETDSKPPPTNNFRRRRSRTSSVGPLQSLVKSATTVSATTSLTSGVAMPVTLFGDDSGKKKTIASTTLAYRASLVGSPEPKENGINVTVTLPSHSESAFAYTESTRSSYASTSGVDTTDCDTDEMTSLRGILKNKPAKPKPYVLGENIDKPDDLWGVQLKPVGQQSKTEIVYKSESPPLNSTLNQKSVAERIQELGSSQSNGFSTKINVSVGNSSANSNNWEESDLPKSNVMSIKLHSPQANKEAQHALKVVPPIAKPRTITNIQETQPSKLHTATTIKQSTSTTSYKNSLPTKASLKIIKEARGARQLRDHELSYFGVSTSEDEKPKSKYTTITNSTFRNSPKRSLPLRKLSEESVHKEQWQLENDKPDLLKHNPIDVKPAERTSLRKKAELEEEEEHLYENIASEITPVFKVKSPQYDRKMDLQRDAMILSEMNKNADQTLRELSDEAAVKDRRRRSLQRRNSKPLETIDEKSIQVNDSCIAVKISRGTFSSEAKKTSRHSTPSPTFIKANSRECTSSPSSIESCPRARSRSLSSEKEYDNKLKPSRATQILKHKPQKHSQSRSSSLDSQRSVQSQYSSGEEQQLLLPQTSTRSAGSFRREDRSRTKTKRLTSSASSSNREKPREEKSLRHHGGGDSKRLSSTTHSSSHRERVECKHDNALGSSVTTQQPTHHRHQSSSAELQRSTANSSSGRRQRDDLRDSQRIKRSSTATAATVGGRSTTERHDKHEYSSGKHSTHSIRDDERNNSLRSSSHRLERGDKEKEKPSSSSARSSKGHSSRSMCHHHNGRIPTNPDKHSTTKDSKTKSSSHTETVTSSKNNVTHRHQSHYRSKERLERHQQSQQPHHHKSKQDEDHTEHVHGLKSAIIKTTTKLRDKSRSRKEKK